MKVYRLTIATKSAFGTPLVGDTLFGQLCWQIRYQYGEERLSRLLEAYTKQSPFLVVSDAFPVHVKDNGQKQYYLPLPTLPSSYWEEQKEHDRKALKKKQWVLESDIFSLESRQWQKQAKAEGELITKCVATQMHNTIDRQTGTTGTGMFAPYSSTQVWYTDSTRLAIYCVIDEERLRIDELENLLKAIGQFGFGRDASIGLGKFDLESIDPIQWKQANANAYLSLANCAPKGIGLDAKRSFYQLNTRFGRHGAAAVGNPFKKPLILAKSGAVLTPKQAISTEVAFLGHGLGDVSYEQPEAVHQGYAPVVPIHLDFSQLG